MQNLYNILAVGLPVLYIGPQESHVTDIASSCHIERWVHASQHGQVDQVVGQILQMAKTAVFKAAYPLPDEFSRRVLLAQMIEESSSMSASEPAHAAAAFHD